jgi:hypothetical protein
VKIAQELRFHQCESFSCSQPESQVALSDCDRQATGVIAVSADQPISTNFVVLGVFLSRKHGEKSVGKSCGSSGRVPGEFCNRASLPAPLPVRSCWKSYSERFIVEVPDEDIKKMSDDAGVSPSSSANGGMP